MTRVNRQRRFFKAFSARSDEIAKQQLDGQPLVTCRPMGRGLASRDALGPALVGISCYQNDLSGFQTSLTRLDYGQDL